MRLAIAHRASGACRREIAELGVAFRRTDAGAQCDIRLAERIATPSAGRADPAESMGHLHFCSAPSVGPIELLLGLGMCQAVLAAIWAAIAREEGPTVLRMISALTEQPRRAMCGAEAQAESSGFKLSSSACETRQTRLAIVLAQLRLDEAVCLAQWLAQSECAVPPPAAQARAATEAQHTSSNRSTLRLFSIDIHTGVVAEVCRSQWMLHAGLRRSRNATLRLCP